MTCLKAIRILKMFLYMIYSKIFDVILIKGSFLG